MFQKKQSYYDRMQSRSKNVPYSINTILKKEETYWVGAAIPAMFIAGIFDGGISIAIAYGARKLYERNNG